MRGKHVSRHSKKFDWRLVPNAGTRVTLRSGIFDTMRVKHGSHIFVGWNKYVAHKRDVHVLLARGVENS